LDISQAFNKTLKTFEIRAKDISEKSGVSEKQISMFRNGRQRLNSDALQSLLEVLPLEARLYFLIQLSEGRLGELGCFSGKKGISAQWHSIISSASLADIEVILRALADRYGELKAKSSAGHSEETLALSA
jgi:transcriptional regulator with XRE-family HTH domain